MIFNRNIFLDELQSLSNNKNVNEVLEFLSKTLKNDLEQKDKIFVKYHLARILFFNNEYEKSEKIFVDIVDKCENEFAILVYLSEIYFKTGRKLESVQILNNLYKNNPLFTHLLKNISIKLESLNANQESFVSKYNLVKNSVDLVKSLPLISIIILCYNKSEMTKKCLSALFKNTNYENYEVIVLDNASVDDTPDYLLSYGETIKLIRSNKNLGFVDGNNLASSFAKGEFLVFLNNDTEPQLNWLNHLYNTFIIHKSAGAAGSMLIYPNGNLQEAGGVIFNDASGWNYGRGMNTTDSRFNYCREVDYCSGASLMIRKDLFEKIGKFDTKYSPAYYEDTDLCFSVRKFGYKVFYNPFSKVIHHEGATAGTDLNSGFKKYQILNSPKFIEKWENELRSQYPCDEKLKYKFSNRKKGKRILIIDDIPPLPDRAAGALRHYHTLDQMLNLGYNVTYVHLVGKKYTDESAVKYFTDFKMRGVEFIRFNYEYWYNFRYTDYGQEYIKSLIESLELKERSFDFIYIAFWYIAEYFIDLIKSIVPNVPILIDTMDIHFLREEREAEIVKDNSFRQQVLDNKKRELLVYSKADVVTTVTENDRIELKKYLKDIPIFVLTDVHNIRDNTPEYEERKDLMFVGNFNHKPNEDAVIFFVNEIFPLIKSRIPDIKFYIVGNNPTQKVNALTSNDVIITGWVPDVKEYIDKCRIEVVPIRYGAGNKGKVGEALSSGIPIVTTTIGAEGMGIEHGVHAFISDDIIEFADYVIELYHNQDIWKKFSEAGKRLIGSQYSSELMRKRLEFIFNHSKSSLKSSAALIHSSPPEVSIVIVTYNQSEFTKKCIDSIKNNVNSNYEIIIIDNASTDDTEKIFTKKYDFIRYYRNHKNIGFPSAANQGISEALGNYILLLNNDIIITKGSVERMLEVINSNPEIGIVGPISNEVSGLQKDKEANYKNINEMYNYAEKIKVTNKGIIQYFPRVAFLCTLIKREVIEKIGGLDERFSPGNYEDDDFCLRAQIAGYKTVIARDVFIHHYGSKSFKANGVKAYLERLKINEGIFVDKWGATPDEIWLQNKQIKPHQIFYPIDRKPFLQHFKRVRLHLSDNELILAQNEIEKAVELFSEGDATTISFDDLLDMAGNLFFAGNNLEKARYYFERELKLNSNSSNACLGLGKVLFADNKFDASKTMFEWSLKNNPENSEAKRFLENVNNLLGFDIYHNSLLEINHLAFD